MSTQTYLPEDTVIRRGLEALMAALGPVDEVFGSQSASDQVTDR